MSSEDCLPILNVLMFFVFAFFLFIFLCIIVLNCTMAVTIFYQNVRGLKSKIELFSQEVLNNNFDIICLTETWLNSSISSSELFDGRYMVFRRDRESSSSVKREGGGVLIAINKHFNILHKRSWQTDAEDLWISFSLTENSNTKFNLGLIYLPPDISQDLFSRCVNNCKNVCLSSHSQTQNLILGDFNLSSITWLPSSRSSDLSPSEYSGLKASSFVEFVSLSDLNQYNYLQNASSRILDLILYDSDNIVVLPSAPLVKVDNYHPPLEIDLDIKRPHHLSFNSDFAQYNFRKTDYARCCSDLSTVDWNVLLKSNCNDSLLNFYNALWAAIKCHTPLKRIRNNKYPVWFSGSLIRVLREKDKYHTKFKRFGNPRDYDAFSLLRKRSKKLLNDNYRTFIDSVEMSLPVSTKSFWNYVKSKKCSNVIPKSMEYNGMLASDGGEVVDLFSKYFSSVFNNPLPTASSNTHIPNMSNFSLYQVNISLSDVQRCLSGLDANKGAGPDGIPPVFVKNCAKELTPPLHIIFSKSLSEGVFPDLWKIANITPIFKGGAKNDVQSYRPISLLSCFSKVFESLLYNHLFNQFHHILSPLQHGFVRKRSTSTNLLEYTDYICKSFNSRTQVDAVYTDFSKAFDKVCHTLLIEKLIKIGVHGNLLEWLKSYISGRSQVVTINGFDSAPVSVTSGVPQGSHLGPLFFIIFINDLIPSLECRSLLYADDLKIFTSVKSALDCEKLQRDLNYLDHWCTANKMSLNIKKCHIISFTRNRSEIKFNYSLGNTPLDRVGVIRDLGVIFDSKLTFRPHIEDIVNRSRRVLGFITRITKPFKRPESYQLLYLSLVRSTLEYASVVWSPHYQVYENMVESVQRSFIRILSYRAKVHRVLTDYNQRLDFFNLSDLRTRRLSAELVFLFKVANGIVETSLLDGLQFNACGRSLRARNLFSLDVCISNVSFNNPTFRMCRLYNRLSLSDEIDLFSGNLSKFRACVRSILW